MQYMTATQKPVAFRLPEELVERAKAAATQAGSSLTAYVREAIEARLQEAAGGEAVGPAPPPSAVSKVAQNIPKKADPYKWNPRVATKNPPSVRPFSS